MRTRDHPEPVNVGSVAARFLRGCSRAFCRVEAAVVGLAGPAEKRRRWTQRLFNRLLFLAFVGQKGWLRLDGRSDYLAALWEAWRREPEKAGRSFHAARLRRLFCLAFDPAGERQPTLPDPVFGVVPWLGGGLVASDAADRDAAVDVPDEAIAPIFEELLARFHFTVAECRPPDGGAAVDPEMLGQVFERCLAGRHASGSYYTPGPIVAFMCREALKHSLAGASGEECAALARFVDEHDPAGLRDGERVLGALRGMRVCDPACGSGAHLVGMLHELAALRECLFARREIGAPCPFTRKLEIIRDNLHGVDLDPLAVSIARLRLWLSLAVECHGETPPVLPGLDFKIRVGESLGGSDPRMNVLRGNQKTRPPLDPPAGAFDWAVGFAEVFAPRSVPGATEPGGFDVIVGNPPYVRQELIKAQKPVLKSRYECFDGSADLYVYFYERAVNLLRLGGTLAFLSSNKFHRSGYGAKLREFLARKTNIQAVIDFGDTPVFGAIAYASILIATRAPPRPEATVRVLTWRHGRGFHRLAETFAEQSQPLGQSGLCRDGWRLESPDVLRLLARLRRHGTALGTFVHGRIYRGILTGLNDAFVVDRATRDRLIAEHASSAELLKPFLRGRDVKRWQLHPQDRWLIFTRRGVRIDAYPAILRFLSAHRTALTPGGPGGRKPGSHPWYEVQDSTSYWQEFARPKIIIPAIAARSECAVDDGGSFCNDKTSICVADDPGHVAAILNSAPADWFIRRTAAGRRGGFFEFKPMYVSAVPIPDATPAERAALSTLADRVRDAKRCGDGGAVRALEAEIDQRVFRLYGLTREERKLVTSAD